MRNVDRFNEYAAVILTQLYESFPVKNDLDVREITGHEKEDEFGIEARAAEGGKIRYEVEVGGGASILDTMGLGVLRAGPDALRRPLAQTLGAAATGLALTAGAADGAPGATAAPAALGASAAAAPADQSIHIGQLIINQQPGEDAGALAERVMREIEQRQRVRSREALFDEL